MRAGLTRPNQVTFNFTGYDTYISEDRADLSTLYMPVTRELSAAKRLIVLTWGDLMNRKYPQQPLQPLSVPCDE